MKKILVTNDDGIHSEGLLRLARAAQPLGELWVIAPETQQSGKSHSFTLHTPIEVRETDYPLEGVHAFTCAGTPADCVRIGLLGILSENPDHVFCGINDGYNVGPDLQYSGTAGAALEASFLGSQAIAFSEARGTDHRVTDRYLREIMTLLLEKPLPEDEIWNVNFPSCPPEECGGILWGRTVSRDRFYVEKYKKTDLGGGKAFFSLGSARTWSAAEGTDLRAVIDGYVSVGRVKNLS